MQSNILKRCERIGLKAINSRMAFLIQKNNVNPNTAVLEEVSQLTIIRDELKRIARIISDRAPAGSLSHGFPTIETLFQRLNLVAGQIAKGSGENHDRHELINEFMHLCFRAESVCKKAG